MSIPGSTPFYVRAHYGDGGVTYALMNPRNFGAEVVKRGTAPTKEWMLNSIRPLVPPWQEDIEIIEDISLAPDASRKDAGHG